MATRVISGNINEEYRKATSKAVALEGLPPEIQKRMQRRSVSGLSVDRVADQMYNPFLQTTEIEVPKDRKERNRWYRYFFLNEPLVHSALTLHTMFPLSSFRVSHEDKEIEDSFNEMIEDIRLFDFILEMGLEYWITGEVFPFGFFDNSEDPQMWTDFIMLHPNFVEVEGDPWVRGKRKKHIWLTPTDSLKKLVEAGPNDEKTGQLYKNLPVDIIEGIKTGKIELGDVQISHVKRPGMYFNTRGTSIIDCILKPLMYRDKLRSAQYSIADRHISPTEFYFIGEPGDPADENELEKFQNALVASWTQPNRAIIWHHAVKVQWEGAAGRILPLQPEFDMIDNQILIGLMVSKGVIFGEGPTFANSSVALDILIQRYLSFRMQIEKWIENCVFAPICKIHQLYKPTEAEIKHKIQIKGKDKPLWIPQVKWDKENLRDNMQKLEFMSRLAEKNIIPWKMVTNLMDLDWETIKKGLEEQRKEAGKAGLPTAPKGIGGIPSLGLPTMPSGGAPGLPATPTGGVGLPSLPGAESPLEGGGPIPAESHAAPGVPTG